MITLLRRIRRTLIDSGMAHMPSSPGGRYLLYALGEIALVVIGILIALQINNWNEERKMVQTVKVYLNNLVESIEDDSIRYASALESSIFRFYSTQYLLELAEKEPYDLKADEHLVDPWQGNRIWNKPIPSGYHEEFIRMAFIWSHRIDFSSQAPSTIEELKKTDEYSYLNNEPLKDAINKYSAERNFRLGPTAEDIYRKIIWAWQNILMDEGLLNSTPFVKGDPIELLKKNPALIGRLRGLAQESSWQAMSFAIIIGKGSKLSSIIEKEIDKI